MSEHENADAILAVLKVVVALPIIAADTPQLLSGRMRVCIKRLGK